MKPTLTVKVDLCNPGQVFACCGLFELAHRLTPQDRPAMGWFRDINKTTTEFLLAAHDANDTSIGLKKVWDLLKACPVSGDEAQKEGPVVLGKPFGFTIDWRKAYPQNRLVKTWAGQQSIAKITADLIASLPARPDASVLAQLTRTKGGVTAYNISKCETAQDAGFSLNDLGNAYQTCPATATELLALIALQRFCPSRDATRLGRQFHVWDRPLPIGIAALAIGMRIYGVSQGTLSFSMYERDSEGRYKAFGISRFKQEN